MADKLYQAMKAVAGKRKIKASPQHDLYWTYGPYFFSSNYFWREWDENFDDNTVKVSIDITVKYWRFDELQYSITDPESHLKFTDKIRANSAIMCHAQFPRVQQPFFWDGSDDTLPKLCQDILDWITTYQMNFVETAETTYGGLDEFYIAHENEYPLLAGLTYVERELYADAERCFRNPQMPYEHLTFSITPETSEQKQRLEHYGYARGLDCFYRDMKSVLIDFAVAKQKGLNWSKDLRDFGLPL